MAVVLGVDPSTHTGIVGLDDLKIIEATEITCKKKFEKTVDRALALSDDLVRVIERVKPSLIVFEGYGYSNQHTLALLVEIGTVFRVVTRLLDIPHVEIAPTALKKVVTGTGTAKKDLMLLEVFKRWGFEAKTDNIADAFGLAVCGQELLGFDTGIPKSHKDGLKKIVLPKQKGV